jgi:hypothetical protein
MENEPIFSTRDLYLATSLVSMGFFMLNIDMVHEGHKNQAVGYFKFSDTPELQDARSRYMQGLLLVEPKMFVTNLKSLKSEVVNANQNPHGFGR